SIDNTEEVETFFQNDIDRIALFKKEKHSTIDWQSTTTPNAGFMHIHDLNEGAKDDHIFTRRICRSIIIDNP
ncbi:MAG: hypothetical protein LBU65_01590, partial [Planctomycetaceae bacterium]|nr:hypothetical protein [Planctomycetaceae bacterium]